MDKRRAIQIMTKAAELYRDNLEDQKVLFLYGLPSEVKKQLQTEEKHLSGIQGYEVAFHRYNFLHLTGVKLNKNSAASAIHFYQKCLDRRLTESDFAFAKDGSTGQKLDILESMMLIKKNVTMIGDFTDRGPKLFSEKAAGNVCGCASLILHMIEENDYLSEDVFEQFRVSPQSFQASPAFMEIYNEYKERMQRDSGFEPIEIEESEIQTEQADTIEKVEGEVIDQNGTLLKPVSNASFPTALQQIELHVHL